jgi:hypothetical protein
MLILYSHELGKCRSFLMCLPVSSTIIMKNRKGINHLSGLSLKDRKQSKLIMNAPISKYISRVSGNINHIFAGRAGRDWRLLEQIEFFLLLR